MPTPDLDFITAPTKTAIQFGLEPAHNGINSLLLIYKSEYLSGLDDWVTRTAAALSPAQTQMHRVVTAGLFYVISPARSWPSFSAYLNDLEAQDPVAMRDRLFTAYARIIPLARQTGSKMMADAPLHPVDPSPLLASRGAFLAYLRERFPLDAVDEQIESEAHTLLNDPPTMKQRVVSHLRFMWTQFLAAEWARVAPMLQSCLEAFNQVDLEGMSLIEAARYVTGQDMKDWQHLGLGELDQLIFVPSAHLGPYLGKFKSDRTLWLLFGARQPQGIQSSSPDLSRSELLTRLLALADDTRLRILRQIADGGELRSPDLMRALNLSQSAASRHLQQLSATGYLSERRRDGAKVYSLNPDRIEDTLNALAQFLNTR